MLMHVSLPLHNSFLEILKEKKGGYLSGKVFIPNLESVTEIKLSLGSDYSPNEDLHCNLLHLSFPDSKSKSKEVLNEAGWFVRLKREGDGFRVDFSNHKYVQSNWTTFWNGNWLLLGAGHLQLVVAKPRSKGAEIDGKNTKEVSKY